jgi:hypothetical protein
MKFKSQYFKSFNLWQKNNSLLLAFSCSDNIMPIQYYSWINILTCKNEFTIIYVINSIIISLGELASYNA